MTKTAKEMYFNHFKMRLEERYGIIINEAIKNCILSQIRDSHFPTYVQKSRSSSNRTIHKVHIDEEPVFVVYKKGTHPALITALSFNRELEAEWKRQERVYRLKRGKGEINR